MSDAPLILAIDTSCDDTAVAITRGVVVLANVVASQTQLHKQYGGVFPTVAKLAHKENIAPTITAALRRAGVTWDAISAIAVTQGPGLAPALEVGIAAAKELAIKHQKPLLPINHIEGHLLSPLARPQRKTETVADFDSQQVNNVLSLVISGGHSEFILVKKIGEYQRLGWTIDDAAGEALDKVGRMLDLGYPAGPVMEEFARLGNEKAFEFPLPMTTRQDYQLSFSGLKTAARNKIETLQATQDLTKTQIYDFSASFQRAVFRAICYKLNKICNNVEIANITEVWLGGGVAANIELRRMIRETIKPFGLQLRVPYSKKICSDNAAMIGLVAGVRTVSADQTFERKPRLGLVV